MAGAADATSDGGGVMLKVDCQFRRDGFELDFKLEMHSGVLGLFGPSGSGKSTAIHIIAGLLKPTRGLVQLGDDVLVDTQRQIDRPSHRRRVGVVFQDSRLFPHMTVSGNLGYGARLRDRSAVVSFEDVVDLLALGSLLDRRPVALSGGEQQRVAIGRALLSHPRLLLLDEPLVGLDRAMKQQVLPMLYRVCQAVKLPIVYVSHDLSEVLQLTDQLLLIDAGKTVAQGSYLDLVQTRAAIQRVLATGLVNVLRLTIAARNEQAGWTQFVPPQTAQPALRGPLVVGDEGDVATILLRPEDIALSTGAVQGISMQNQWRGTVSRVIEQGGQRLVEVDIGLPLLVEVTGGSFERLGLDVGRPVWCLAKSNALQVLTVERTNRMPTVPTNADRT